MPQLDVWSAFMLPALHGFWLAATSSVWTVALVVLLVLARSAKLVQTLRYPRARRDPVRRFSSADKRVILTRAGDRCENHSLLVGRCRQVEGLEADHVHPHSRGGQTALANGQALCRRHNRSKNASIPWTSTLRALERRRSGYFPPGTPVTVVRLAPRR